jgi:hypothetical protein
MNTRRRRMTVSQRAARLDVYQMCADTLRERLRSALDTGQGRLAGDCAHVLGKLELERDRDGWCCP